MLERSKRCGSIPPTSMPYFSTSRKPKTKPNKSGARTKHHACNYTGRRLARARDNPAESMTLRQILDPLGAVTYI
jgi:hypothetical protein